MTTASADLNPILARWWPTSVETVRLDCRGCSHHAKCCDFQPFVANFLLGAMLEDGVRLPLGEFSYQPLGLIPAASFRARHAATADGHRGDDLVCAFFDRKLRQCGVWAQRPGECSSYLCTPPTPARSALSHQSFALETSVGQMALAMQGFSGREIQAQIDFLNLSGTGIDPEPSNVLEVYRQAWAWARTLAQKDVRAFVEDV